MSLQVWLPLNGNLNNQGLGTVSADSQSANYKVGKTAAQSYNLNIKRVFTCPQLADLKTFSICFWAMTEPSSTLQTDWQDLIGFADISSSGVGGIFRWETCYGTASSGGNVGIHWHDNGTNAMTTGSARYISVQNEWVHCCVVFDFESLKVYTYSNGSLLVTHTHNGGHFNSAGQFYLGETNNIEGRIQDVRIYDHALSPKEVKEISKGLCLHYKLDNNGAGQENLGKNSGNFTTTNKYTTTSPSLDNFICPGIYYNNFDTTKTYTLTVECDGTLNAGHAKYRTPSDRYWTIWIYYDDTPFNDTDYNRYKTPICFTSATSGFKKISDTKYSWTFTPQSKNGSIRFNTYSDGTTPITVNFWNVKIEMGSTATPWCPHTSDALYSQLGFNQNIEYDCSGYGNNGTKTTVTASSDTARHTSSSNFVSNSKITSSKGFPIGTVPIFTVNFWYKPSIGKTFGQWCDVCGCDKFRLETCNAGGTGYNWFGSFADSSGLTMFSMNESKWYMVTLVSDGVTLYQYLNGNLYAKRTLSDTYKNWTTNGSLYIGDQVMYFNMSDFRIYASALSAEEIRNIYETSISIDNTGNVLGYDILDGYDFVNVNPNGTIYSKEIIENGTIASIKDNNDVTSRSFYEF